MKQYLCKYPVRSKSHLELFIHYLIGGTYYQKGNFMTLSLQCGNILRRYASREEYLRSMVEDKLSRFINKVLPSFLTQRSSSR